MYILYIAKYYIAVGCYDLLVQIESLTQIDW